MKKLTTICPLLLSAALMLGQSAARKDAPITAVTGESWLHHINRSFDETSMGKTWRLGPATDESDPRSLRSSRQSSRGSMFPATGLPDSTGSGSRMETLRGSDLYRLNCQGCHGEHGLGAPPEIGSVIDPVRATSLVLVAQRMKKTGMELSRRETEELVKQSRSALLKRLHEGGTDMPSFHHFSEAEIRSLVAYLNQLAGVPAAAKEQVAIQESHARVGELIVKSTCHVCHDAMGPNPTPAQLLDGTIPPLSALPMRVNKTQLVRKVTRGAPVIMGTTSSVYRGRMPVFSYLSENEAADVYEYLTHYPPHYPPIELASIHYIPQPSQLDQTNLPSDPGGPMAAPQPGDQITSGPTSRSMFRSPSQPASTQVSISREQTASAVLPICMGLFTTALLALGCWITLREFKRLSVGSQAHTASRRAGKTPAMPVMFRPAVEMLVGSPSPRAQSMEQKPYDWLDEEKIS
ncbi:MAG TPA: cytochrome c [Terriglobales bacterium]|jgi:mono/diheme cytochrome c family protein|nr:cytochrome c [Terriglobales bacterium]